MATDELEVVLSHIVVWIETQFQRLYTFSGSPDSTDSVPASGLEMKEIVYNDIRTTDFYDETMHWCSLSRSIQMAHIVRHSSVDSGVVDTWSFALK